MQGEPAGPIQVPSARPGFRDSGYNKGYGALRNVGYNGFSWSSSIPTGNDSARNLGFSYGGLTPRSSSNRANGLLLRCLQEEGKNKATATAGRASRRHPPRRKVPLGTRKLGFSRQSSAGGDRENAFAQRSLSARLGKSFPINSSFIGLISS